MTDPGAELQSDPFETVCTGFITASLTPDAFGGECLVCVFFLQRQIVLANRSRRLFLTLSRIELPLKLKSISSDSGNGLLSPNVYKLKGERKISQMSA